jgi:hypothetical protein
MNVTVSNQSVDPRLELVLAMILGEREHSRAKHGPMRSPHEAWGVIAEEWDEFKDELRANNMELALAEGIQCAAGFLNFIMEVVPPELVVRAYAKALHSQVAPPAYTMATDGCSMKANIHAERMGERR